MTWEGLCDEVGSPALLCGEIRAGEADLIRQRLGLSVVVASPASSLRRAAYLAELGWNRLARGESDDAATLSAIYVTPAQLST